MHAEWFSLPLQAEADATQRTAVGDTYCESFVCTILIFYRSRPFVFHSFNPPRFFWEPFRIRHFSNPLLFFVIKIGRSSLLDGRVYESTFQRIGWCCWLTSLFQFQLWLLQTSLLFFGSLWRRSPQRIDFSFCAWMIEIKSLFFYDSTIVQSSNINKVRQH